MFSVEWQFVTIMYTYCIPSNSLSPPSPSQAFQYHAQSKNKCGYVMANVVIIWPSLYPDKYCCHHRLLLVWCLVMATSSWCLWSLSRHRAICGLWPPPPPPVSCRQVRILGLGLLNLILGNTQFCFRHSFRASDWNSPPGFRILWGLKTHTEPCSEK